MRVIAFWLSQIMIVTIPWANFVSLPGLGEISRVTGIIAGAFWLLAVLLQGKIRKITPFFVFVFLFFLWDAISILWSNSPQRTLTEIFTYAQIALFCLMLWDLYVTPDAIKLGLQAYVIGLSVPISSTASSFIANAGSEYAEYGRYSSAGNNTNTTAILLAIGIPLAWYLAAAAGEGKLAQMQRLINYTFIPAIMFAIILTATRFAVIMSLPAFLFGFGTLTRLKPGTRIMVFGLLIVALVILLPMLPQASLQRLNTIDDEIQSGNLNDRTDLWSKGLDLWLEHPLIGIGAAGFDTAVAPIYGRPRAAHNSFVAITVELGIIGIMLFGLIMIAAVFLAWGHKTKLDALFWLTTLITWGLGNFALTWMYSKPTWLLLTLLAASASLNYQPKEATLKNRQVAYQF